MKMTALALASCLAILHSPGHRVSQVRGVCASTYIYYTKIAIASLQTELNCPTPIAFHNDHLICRTFSRQLGE